jgi:hypothetical protein
MNFVFRRALPFALIVFLLPGLFAQDAKTDQGKADQGQSAQAAAPDSDTSLLDTDANDSPFKRGEGLFSVQLGTDIPLFYWNPNTSKAEATNLYPGGMVSLRYMNFVATSFALGGEVGAAYNISTQVKRNYYQVPFSFEAMWMGAKMPFEFPVGMGVGVAINKLGDYLHFDPFVRLEGGVYYRATPAWSFGLMAAYVWMPEFYSSAANDRFGNFMTVSLSVFNHI